MPSTLLPTSAKTRLLIVDDDLATQMMLSEVLIGEGYEVYLAPRVQDVRACFDGPQPDVILLDWRLPDGDGMELLTEIRDHWPRTRVVMMSGYGSAGVASEAAKRGAFQFLGKPFHVDQLIQTVNRACAAAPALGPQPKAGPVAPVAPPLIESPAMQPLLRLAEQVAPLDAPVLITGESGTGKSVLAHFLHARSRQASGPLITVDCAAVLPEMLDNQFFGAVAGAHAAAETPGFLLQAKGGTLLLDEIGALPPAAQGKLVPVLQTRQFLPAGSNRAEPLEARLLSTTRLLPAEALRAGKLHEGFYQRVSTIALHVPPLRERREDILPLARTFLKWFAPGAARAVGGFTPTAEAALRRYDWPGNVRQLENEIQRAVSVGREDAVELKDLSALLQAATGA